MRADDIADWISGLGYIRVRQQIHVLEQRAFLAAPVSRMLAEAMSDQLRLQGSTIENREALLAMSRQAVTVLANLARLCNPLPEPVPQLHCAPQNLDGQLARELLRRVRQAIDEFRDERRQGLVRVKLQLYRSVLVTGSVCYALLALSVLVKVDRKMLLAAMVFFLIGAVVGVFQRLYLDGSAESAVEDYGLSYARQIHTPLLSGVAAVVGVLVIPMLSIVVNSSAGTTGLNQLPTLQSIFSLSQRPFGFVLAMIFGLSPATLISRLQREAERYKTDLKSSETPAQKQ